MSCTKTMKKDSNKISQNRKKNVSNTDSKLINVNETFISTIKSEAQQNDCNCDQPEQQSQKLTYSAQHQIPHLGYQQTFLKSTSTMANKPSNMESVAYPYYNGMPVYNVSSGMMNRRQNSQREPIIPMNRVQYSCPCSSIPPPAPPPRDDLWDLQFCRWWGWNWVRKREEMLNQKRAELKMKSNVSNSSVSKKRTEEKIKSTASNSSVRSKKQRVTKKKRRKQDDFFTWWNKLFRKQKKKTQLQVEEKKQLQNLYDTPCSSVTFNDNNCPCPINDWECRSIKLEGDYKCYCSSTGKTSLSTILVRNKTRRQACKQRKRKHQSWVFEKTDTSSSEECCPCLSACPHKGESSADESVEYLSLRMAHVKSDSEDNVEYCPIVKVKECNKNYQKPVCCPCKAHRKDVCYSYPCKIKLICEKQNKPPKQRCIVREHPVTKQHHCCDFRPRDNSPPPCRSWPVCKVPPPVKVPRLRKLPPTKPICKPFPQLVRRCKRKYIPEPCCQKNKEYILYCPCQCPPRKRIKRCKKQKKVYHCCCCCCCCCNDKIRPGHQSESTDNLKMMKLEPSENSKHATDNNVNCTHDNAQNSNMNNVNANQILTTNTQPFAFSPALQNSNQLQENYMRNLQPIVSKALDKGLYISPLTGKTYALHHQIFSVNETQNQSHLPKPLDLNEKMFNIPSLQSPLADQEHQSLLNAVCEAILSSRVVNKDTNKLSLPSSRSELLPSDLWGNFKVAPLIRHRRPRIFRTGNIYKNREHYLTEQDSDELVTHNYESDQTDTYQSRDMENDRCENLPTSQFAHFAVSKDSKYHRINDPIIEIPNSSYKMFEEDSGNPNVNARNSTLTTQNKHSNSNAVVVATDARKHKTLLDSKGSELSKSINTGSRKTRIPIRIGNRKLFVQKRFSNSPNEQNVPVSFNSLQKENRPDHTNWKNTSYNKICENNTDFKKATLIQKSSEMPQSTLQKINNKNNENNHLSLPFNSPQSWITSPKFAGVSLTGLLSSVSDTKDSKDYSSVENKYKINVDHFRKRKLYDIFFANNKPDFCEDFPNVPINFSPGIPPSGAPCLINHLPTCPLVLQELPAAEVTQATQTRGHDVSTSIDISQTESEKELQCLNLTQGKRPCHTESKAIETQKNTCIKSQKSICPKETGINTAISCVREVLKYEDTPNVNEIGQNISFTRENQSEKELISFTRENQSEKEITSTNFDENTSKRSFPQLSDTATLTDVMTKDSNNGPESTCLFLRHNQQSFKLFNNPNASQNNKPEKLVSVINRISEESVSDLLSTTDLHSHVSVSETSSFLSFLQSANKESAASSVLSEDSPPFNIKYSQTYPENPVVNSTTSPLKIRYTTIRKGDRSETDYYSRRKVQRKESPFSMFCVPVLSKNVHSRPGSDRDSVSRPERKMVVTKQLKEREKRWRY